MAKLFANSGDPDQTLCSAASDMGLHCLPITRLWVFRLQWVKKVVFCLQLYTEEVNLQNFVISVKPFVITTFAQKVLF